MCFAQDWLHPPKVTVSIIGNFDSYLPANKQFANTYLS